MSLLHYFHFSFELQGKSFLLYNFKGKLIHTFPATKFNRLIIKKLL